MIGAQLNRGNYFASSKDLVLAAYWPTGAGRNQFVDLSPYQQTAVIQSKGAGAGWVNGPDGPAFNFPLTTEVRYTNRTGFPNNLNLNISVLMLVNDYQIGTTTSGYINVGLTTGTNNAFVIGTDATTASKLAIDNTTAEVDSTVSIPSKQFCVIGYTQQSTNSRTFAVNSRSGLAFNNDTTAVGSAVIDNNEPWNIGRTWVNGAVNAALDFKGIIGWVFVWSRGFDPNSFLTLVQNPGQLVTLGQPWWMEMQNFQPVSGPTTVSMDWPQPSNLSRPIPTLLIPY